MKYGSIKTVCLAVLSCMAIMAANAQSNVYLTSIVLEDFNDVAEHNWIEGNSERKFNFSWGVDWSQFGRGIQLGESEFAEEVELTYVNAWPLSLLGFQPPQEKGKSLGIRGSFRRPGHNWIDIYPVADNKPFEVPMPGRIQRMEVWVWGSNLNYTLQAYVRDNGGKVHILDFGSINHTGWKSMALDLPVYISQTRRVLPSFARLHFIKFRVWTQPTEKFSEFYVYFNQFKVVTDVFDSRFDGDDLADPDRLDEFWRSGK